jgi:hypothetical protein
MLQLSALVLAQASFASVTEGEGAFSQQQNDNSPPMQGFYRLVFSAGR